MKAVCGPTKGSPHRHQFHGTRPGCDLATHWASAV